MSETVKLLLVIQVRRNPRVAMENIMNESSPNSVPTLGVVVLTLSSFIKEGSR